MPKGTKEEFMDRLNGLAHLRGKCLYCDGVGGTHTPEGHVECPYCCGSSKGDYLLPDMVRERCPGRNEREHEWLTDYYGKCPVCHGLGTVASRDGMVWEQAALEMGYEVTIWREDGYTIVAMMDKEGNQWAEKGSGVHEALIGAFEKAMGWK
jgi:hypothetical protein